MSGEVHEPLTGGDRQNIVVGIGGMGAVFGGVGLRQEVEQDLRDVGRQDRQCLQEPLEL